MVTSTSSIPASSATTTSSTSTLSSDVYNKVEQVMTSQSAGVTKLNNSLTADQTTISALGQLQSALADFQSVAQSLAGAGLSMAATSSASGILSATTSDQAATGSHTVDVQQLAQGQALSSAVQASPTSAIGSGASTVIKIASASGASQSITINNTNNSLQGIAGALQAAGVNAQVVQGSGGYALTIVGASGAANGMSISVSGDASIQGLMAYDPAGGKGMTQTAAAQDAVLTVDGKQVSSPTNSVGGAIAGTTLALSGTGSTTLTVAQDSSQIASNVASLASAYNTLNAKLQTLQGGGLQSDTAVN
ncbi:MAG TPA: flagellar filament capping protein FliD, partial [Janthinobacterium sp.]|nr:flagellar filament capping protein FliD [Janthinobacterium sp.]